MSACCPVVKRVPVSEALSASVKHLIRLGDFCLTWSIKRQAPATSVLAELDKRVRALCPDLASASDAYAGLLSDMVSVWELFRDYAAEVGAPKVTVKLELVRGVMCPKLHADNVGYRLVRVYCGPGTQYVPHEWQVDRVALAKLVGCASSSIDDMNSVILRGEPTSLLSVPAEHVIVMRGAKNHPHGGCVHMSPKVDAEEPRLLLKMDA